MSREYTFDELQTDVKELLNFNSAQTDQDFTTNQVKKAINRAYTREVTKAQQHGGRSWFRGFSEITWAASALTLTLPAHIAKRLLINVEDITNSDPGGEFTIGENSMASEVFWKDYQTLQWGDAGPSSATTLRFYFYSLPVEMNQDADAPDIIPVQHRELLVWSAAIELRKYADEQAPPAWVEEHREQQLDFWKTVSRGRPASSLPRLGWADGISISAPAVTQDGSSIGL